MIHETASEPRVVSLLRQLATFRPLDPADWAIPGAPPAVLELGVAEDDDGAHLLAWAPDLSELWLIGPEGAARARLGLEQGLLRIPLLEAEGLQLASSAGGPPALRLPSRATPLPAPPPLQGLDAVEQALDLGNMRAAAALLGQLAGDEPSPVRARLARDLADRIERAEPASTRGAARVGQCLAVLAWRSWSGLVTVSATLARGRSESSELEPELARALELGGRLGRALARRVRGLDPAPAARAPEIERTASLLKLADPGGAMALPAALAACSAELRRPLPADLVALGGLDEDGRLAPLPRERLRLVLSTLTRELPGARLLLGADSLDEGGGVTVIRAATLEEAARLGLGELAPGPSLRAPAETRLLDEAELDEREYRRDDALAKARRFLASGGGSPEERLRAHWLEGACLVHLGRPEEARTSFDLAWGLLRDIERQGPFDRAVGVYLSLAEADAFTDLFRYADALAALERGRELAGRSAVLRSKLDAFQGLVLVHAGRPAEAVVVLERACAQAIGADAPRFRCWLGNALVELGEHEDAWRALQDGLALAARAGGAAEPVNRAYLLLALSRLELRRLDAGRARSAADDGLELARVCPGASPYPHSSLLHARGAALLLGGEHEGGVAALEAARGFTAPTAFIALVFGRSELERARALVEREPDGPRARDALRRCRELISGYAPARARFARELAELALPDPAAAQALSALLRTLKY